VEAGSSIRGSIDFEVQRSIYANALRVTFIGEERTRVAETNTKRSAEESHVLHSFVEKLDRVIRTGKIRIGKFSLEFTIPVPLNCPPTIGIPWTVRSTTEESVVVSLFRSILNLKSTCRRTLESYVLCRL
jgi:hypothetical protein